MKLVDIKGNINPKQRLILIITILLLLIVIFGILKSVTKKSEGIDYKNINTDDLIIESSLNNDKFPHKVSAPPKKFPHIPA